MEVPQTLESLVNDPHCLGRGQLPAALEDFFQGLALQVLHDQVMQPVALTHLERADHVGVLELDGQPGFSLEAGQGGSILGLGTRQNLNGHHLPQAVHGPVHPRHAAPAETIKDFVVPKEEMLEMTTAEQLQLVRGHVLMSN
jgi:hypothetical protein